MRRHMIVSERVGNMMIAHKYHKQLKRSKSMCSLGSEECMSKEKEHLVFRGFRSRTISNSSIEVYVVNDSDSDETKTPARAADSGLGDRSFDGALLNVLEQKIDKLSDMFLEQCRLLTTLKEEIRNSRTVIEKADCTQLGTLSEIVKKVISNGNELSTTKELSSGNSFLDAIEYRATDYDQLVREVISGFLQSDEVKEQMVQATAQSVKGVIGRCVSRDISAIYLPVLEHSHRRLLRTLTKTVEDSFLELEENSACLSKSVYKMSNSLRRVIERHQCLLEAMTDPQKNTLSALKYSVEELLQKELKQWRQKVVDMFSLELQSEPEEIIAEPSNLSLKYVSQTPTQPVDSGRSVIDQLMISAEITKQIEEGDVNGAFERALCASDLVLVMSACRAAARAQVFAPRCRLRQHVLLALAQQLSTDMLHDTQLKCRYLEDAILNLDLNDPNTRMHLPLVVGEIRKHLMKFMVSYPSHEAYRRVALIKLAADNLSN